MLCFCCLAGRAGDWLCSLLLLSSAKPLHFPLALSPNNTFPQASPLALTSSTAVSAAGGHRKLAADGCQTVWEAISSQNDYTYLTDALLNTGLAGKQPHWVVYRGWGNNRWN